MLECVDLLLCILFVLRRVVWDLPFTSPIIYTKIRDILTEKIISLNGNKKNLINTIINPNIGEIKYWNIFERFGKTNSLENNLIASLKGCINPINLTFFFARSCSKEIRFAINQFWFFLKWYQNIQLKI